MASEINHTNGTSESQWNPINILDPKNSTLRYGLIVLNRPINLDRDFMVGLWDKAKFRITVDGGTDRWLSWLKKNSDSIGKQLCRPELVTGDMDSILLETLNRLCLEGAPPKVIRTPDQDETDFGKALKEANTFIQENKIEIDAVIVLVETSGRFDHICANINVLYRSNNLLPNLNIYQLASDSLSWLLKPGHHSITIPEPLRNSNTWCGLIPFGHPAIITSTGLKWNLDKTVCEFGGCVSTSNTYAGCPIVTIDVSSGIIWTMGLEGMYPTQDLIYS